jgi:hypothetical protein
MRAVDAVHLPARSLRRVVTTAAALLLTMSGVAAAAPATATARAVPRGAPSTVGIASTPTGYLEVTDAGNVFNHHTAFYGSMAGRHLPAPVVGIAVDPYTDGYWLVTSAGNVYNFHAPWYGSPADRKLPAPVVGITATSTGYLLTTADGNVYNFHTSWYGSRAATGVPAPVVGIAVDPFSDGYWLATADGNVYNFHAPWYGSPVRRSAAPVDGVVATPTGYLVTTTAGNVFSYNTAFNGSPVAEAASSPMVAVTADPAVHGAYWVAAEDGAVYGFGAPDLGRSQTALAAGCDAAQLQVTEGNVYGAVGHSAVPVRFTNRSGQLCRIFGYPGVAGLSPSGIQVLQAQRSLRGYMGGLAAGNDAPPDIPLAPGETATALVEGLNGANVGQSCPKLSGLLVTPPDTSHSTRVPEAPGDCGGLQVHPVVFGNSGVGRA